jgi:alkanesulfonate monooxygenase SsuD/methylene tetrahydromethanopterin reductase-like flavin-dependent oxidoreductase (luciferase family)
MLSKYLETDLTGLPVDGPVPATTQKVGGSSLRTTISETAQAQGLTIRKTYERVVMGSGGCCFKGSFTQVADEMAEWFTGQACDGFVISGPVMPRGLAAVVEGVIPELRRRGLFHSGYAGHTFRDSLGLVRPQNRFFPPAVAKASRPA